MVADVDERLIGISDSQDVVRPAGETTSAFPLIGGGVLAGGGLSHGRTIGSTDRQGGVITSQKVGPADIAATIYRHLGIPLETTYVDAAGRPRFIVDSGTPIDDLFV